jgi:hypothetical protein
MTVNIRLGIDADYVLSALLRHNYLPAHKPDLSQLLPLFSTTTLSNEVATALAASGGTSTRCSYESITHLSTRFNNVPRPLSVPHPVPQSRLSLCIQDNWNDLRKIRTNANSFVRPKYHPDRRLFAMDYGGGASASLQGTLRYRQLDKPSGALALQVHLGVLEDAGIPALLDPPPIYASPGVPHYATMLRFRLMVPAARIAEARRALMQARQAGGELGETARG